MKGIGFVAVVLLAGSLYSDTSNTNTPLAIIAIILTFLISIYPVWKYIFKENKISAVVATLALSVSMGFIANYFNSIKVSEISKGMGLIEEKYHFVFKKGYPNINPVKEHFGYTLSINENNQKIVVRSKDKSMSLNIGDAVNVCYGQGLLGFNTYYLCQS